MTTKEEFQAAIDNMSKCKASLACGCQIDKDYAEYLYYQCKTYIEIYKEVVK